jgi:hypothetical protein
LNSGHDTTKKVAEIHKTNELLQQQLFEKVQKYKSLEEKHKVSEK